jgi:DNA-binding CsgD family transcriptional regulator/tetratricopeptide (TPR) repeat protein
VTEVPRRFRFRHPLVRRAVYEASPAGWRLGAHERSAEALTARGAPVSALAHHVERSARDGDLEAVTILREAGDALAQHTPAGAGRWYGAALRILGDAGPRDLRVELLTSLASADAATGRFAEARKDLLDAIALAPADDAGLRVTLTAACAGIEQLLGRHEEAHSRLEAALAALDDQRSPEAAALMINLALDAVFRLPYAEARRWASRALETAEPLGDLPLRAAASAMLALADALSGAVADAERATDGAAALVDAMADDELALRLDAMAYLSAAEAHIDRFQQGVDHGLRGLEVARATGQGQLLPMLIPAAATSLFASGRLAEGCGLLDGGIESARLTGNVQALAWNLLNRAFGAMLAGESETALAWAEESVELSRSLDDGFVSMYSGVFLGVALIEVGEAERGAELVIASAGGEGLPLIPGGWRANYLEDLTRALVLAGRREEAEQAANHARAVSAATGLASPFAWAERAAAIVALDAGDAAAAVDFALASAEAADRVGMPIQAGLSRMVAGRALAQAGERDRAVYELEAAAAALETHGALRYRAQAERELRKLGRTTPRRSRRTVADGSGIEALSQRELQVARLVAEGKSNPEIGAELFLSRKTVETHLRNIFRKLDVSSRLRVAQAIQRAET